MAPTRKAGRLDVTIHKGDPQKPLFIFIHGLGMSKLIWTDPGESRAIGGLVPISLLLGRYERPFKTLFHDLMESGASVIAWSQTRPVGPAEQAVKELMEVIGMANKITHRGLGFICHSRGGLILRHALNEIKQVDAFVTICSPHHGSEMAKWAEFVSPIASSVNQILRPSGKGALKQAVKRSLDFLGSKAVRELLPGSEFLRSLPEMGPEGAYCLSIGGTDPRLLKINGGLLTLEKILPKKVLPDEMRTGKGDVLVSASSARLSYESEHIDFAVNHVEVMVDPEVRESVMSRLRKELYF